MSDKKFLILILVIFIPYFYFSIMEHGITMDDIELLELQIEEKQLKIKQLKSGACINE